MRRLVSLTIIGLACSAFAAAQIQPLRPGQPRARRQAKQAPGPEGEDKLRWVCKQLQLDEQQWQQAEALIAVYQAELEDVNADPTALLRRIQDKYAAITAAKADGNLELAEKLQAELKNMAPSRKAENDFFDGLKQVLTDEQQAQLPKILAQADTVGDISLRPIHVLRAARATSLTADQQDRLETVIQGLRKRMATSKPEDKAETDRLLAQFVDDVRALLTPEQVEKFDAQIETWRGNAPSATPVKAAGAPPKAPTLTPPKPPPAPDEKENQDEDQDDEE